MKLRTARVKSGKTQAQVAKEAKIGERLYQEYEYDHRGPNTRTTIRIARAAEQYESIRAAREHKLAWLRQQAEKEET